MLTIGTVSDTQGFIYTTPATTKAQIKSIKLHARLGATVQTVVLYLTVAPTTVEIDSFVLNAGDTIEVAPSFPYEFIVSGDGVQAETTDTNSVDFSIGGVESAL